jgi:uncharacterized protein YbjT (DUF2867 family)
MTERAPILVTGAAGGRQGSTGNHVARMLLERGLAVRAFVHADDDRAAALRELGADVVAGDLRDVASVWPAMAGVRRAFFTFPVTDGLLDATAAFAAAASAHRLEQVVNVSQLSPTPDAGTPRMRQHWVAEQVLDRFGVGAVHLRATVFFENFRSLIAVAASADDGRFAIPLGGTDTAVPLIAGEDVARVAAALLAAPAAHEPQPIPLVGQVPTVGDIVAAFSRATGRDLAYADVPSGEWKRAALAHGVNPHAAEHLASLWDVIRTRSATLQQLPADRMAATIEHLTGTPPQTLESFLQLSIGKDKVR